MPSHFGIVGEIWKLAAGNFVGDCKYFGLPSARNHVNVQWLIGRPLNGTTLFEI